jgi:hypothetical protein
MQQTPWRLAPSTRKWILVLHILCSVGWMGVDLALFLLLLNARHTSSATEAMTAYTAVALVVPAAVPVLCLGILVTGLLLGWGSAWGILRNSWVFIKLVLSLLMTALVFVALLPAIHGVPDISTLPSAEAVRERLGPLGIELIFPPIVSFLLLGVAVILSVFKPRGLTPWTRTDTALKTATSLESDPAFWSCSNTHERKAEDSLTPG